MHSYEIESRSYGTRRLAEQCTREQEFGEFQVTGHVHDLGNQIPNLLPVTSSGICHQDVSGILRNKTTNKDNLEETDIHNNMVLNKEFVFVQNVIMSQNTGSVLHTAL